MLRDSIVGFFRPFLEDALGEVVAHHKAKLPAPESLSQVEQELLDHRERATPKPTSVDMPLKTPKYTFVKLNNPTTQQPIAAVRILSGEFTGLAFRAGKVSTRDDQGKIVIVYEEPVAILDGDDDVVMRAQNESIAFYADVSCILRDIWAEDIGNGNMIEPQKAYTDSDFDEDINRLAEYENHDGRTPNQQVPSGERRVQPASLPIPSR